MCGRGGGLAHGAVSIGGVRLAMGVGAVVPAVMRGVVSMVASVVADVRVGRGRLANRLYDESLL